LRNWLLVLVALVALGLAAFFALPRIVSACAHQSPRPPFGVAALLLLSGAGSGLYLIARGALAQRTLLFGGTILILLGYGLVLSMILPLALETAACGLAG
jgi:hypothetical protein